MRVKSTNRGKTGKEDVETEDGERKTLRGGETVGADAVVTILPARVALRKSRRFLLRRAWILAFEVIPASVFSGFSGRENSA